MKAKHLILLIIILSIGLRCGSAKKTNYKATIEADVKKVNEELKNKETLETIETITELKGDSLWGKFQLPKKLTKEPVEFNVNSDGATLKIRLTDTDLQYQLNNKTKGTTTTKSTKKETDKGIVKQTKDSSLKQEVSLAEEKKPPWQFPWIRLSIIIIVLLLIYKAFKSKFNIKI